MEDYFVHGMKESNKYCCFAFKDHYVNHDPLRNRDARIDDSKNYADKKKSISLSNKKLFSANGYCIFQVKNLKKYCILFELNFKFQF